VGAAERCGNPEYSILTRLRNGSGKQKQRDGNPEKNSEADEVSEVHAVLEECRTGCSEKIHERKTIKRIVKPFGHS
jgi:hypothetical protein